MGERLRLIQCLHLITLGFGGCKGFFFVHYLLGVAGFENHGSRKKYLRVHIVHVCYEAPMHLQIHFVHGKLCMGLATGRVH